MACGSCECVKREFEGWLHLIADHCVGTYTQPIDLGRSERVTASLAIDIFKELSVDKKRKVYDQLSLVHEVEKSIVMEELSPDEKEKSDLERLAKAIRRAGVLDESDGPEVEVLHDWFAEGRGASGFADAVYYSLEDKVGRDPASGWVGYVNGMGNISLEHAKRICKMVSRRYLDGCNVHAVYHPSHQRAVACDPAGYLGDVLRMCATNSGHYTKTSVLLVQLWIDYLTEHPEKKFLQIAHSEGTSHINAALNIVKMVAPELLPRIRVIAFCPAYVMLAEDYEDSEDPEKKPQIHSFVKLEDSIIMPCARRADRVLREEEGITIVAHETRRNPHLFINRDYISVAKPMIDRFVETGDIH